MDRWRELDDLALAVCQELVPRLGPVNRNVVIDSDGETIELLAECHGDAWRHLGFFTADEASAVLASLREIPIADGDATEESALLALGLTRAAMDDPWRLRT